MDARNYYRQSHNIPQGTSCSPHVEDSGPAGRPCFRRGTLRTRPDVVCSYPAVSGILDFWAVARRNGAVDIGQYAIQQNPRFDINSPMTWKCYALMQEARDLNFPSHPETAGFLKYRAYPPKVRCSRIAFIGGLGYEADYITLPAEEIPGDNPPTPSAETFLGWYGFDRAHKTDGIIDMETEEGWGRPVFDFTPLAAHADQSWAFAPATPTRKLDVSPSRGTTTIPAGSWQYADRDGQSRNSGLPPADVDIDNWWLLAMIGGFPRPGKNTVTPFYWNPEKRKNLTLFGRSGGEGLTDSLFQTILWRIYSSHCRTASDGIPFPPGFLVDLRIIADTYECTCTSEILEAANVSPVVVFSTHTGRDHCKYKKIYMGTHFSVLYRCPFPIWRRAAS